MLRLHELDTLLVIAPGPHRRLAHTHGGPEDYRDVLVDIVRAEFREAHALELLCVIPPVYQRLIQRLFDNRRVAASAASASGIPAEGLVEVEGVGLHIQEIVDEGIHAVVHAHIIEGHDRGNALAAGAHDIYSTKPSAIFR